MTSTERALAEQRADELVQELFVLCREHELPMLVAVELAGPTGKPGNKVAMTAVRHATGAVAALAGPLKQYEAQQEMAGALAALGLPEREIGEALVAMGLLDSLPPDTPDTENV